MANVQSGLHTCISKLTPTLLCTEHCTVQIETTVADTCRFVGPWATNNSGSDSCEPTVTCAPSPTAPHATARDAYLEDERRPALHNVTGSLKTSDVGTLTPLRNFEEEGDG